MLDIRVFRSRKIGEYSFNVKIGRGRRYSVSFCFHPHCSLKNFLKRSSCDKAFKDSRTKGADASCNDFTWYVPHPSIHAKFYGSEQVANARGHEVIVVWPRNRVDTLTGSYNGQGSAHRVTKDETCLAHESDALEIYERIDLRNKGV
ncbi:hypothetical protein TNCV_5105301 [Trichonephila clavipes]|nr:hypothetical protein TNCV_5105301 [Trichonephila clavipes]